MAQISRLKDAEISNGNLINADDLDAEFNQLVNESNGQDTRLTNIESNNVTLAGIKTFSSAPKTDQIDERTSNTGVTVDGVLLKDGYVKPVAVTQPYAPAANGEFGYDSTNHSYDGRVNGVNVSFLHTGSTISLPTGHVSGHVPIYASAATVTIPSGFNCRSADDTMNIVFGADQTASLASSGANGLDTGSESANTWYYLWAIGDSTGGNVPKALLSTSGSSPTMPSGYDKKRRLLAIRNDGSSNILPFQVREGWPHRAVVHYQVNDDPYVVANSQTNVLNAGTQTSFTDVSCASYAPPTCRGVFLSASKSTSNAWNIRENGSTLTYGTQVNHLANDQFYGVYAPLDASQIFEYKVASGSVTFNVSAYVWEVL